MPSIGILLSLPTESVAVRATVASLVGVALVALLLRSSLQVPRVRSIAALVPLCALVGAVVSSWGELLLPTLMTSTRADNALPVLVRGGYVRFAPVAWPLLVIWVVVASLRLAARVRGARHLRLLARSGKASPDLRVQQLTPRLARRLRVPQPRVVVVEECPGGAAVVGLRQPTIVVDMQLLASLDDEELEGLLAHELAHVRRRDNLLAFMVGIVRDLFFFVPGGRWVTRWLCEERELAADQIAVRVTRRPGALASGLLKVIDNHRAAPACATFAAPAVVVARVERLVAEGPGGGAARTAAESALVFGALTVAVAIAVQLPAAIAGQAGERDALALLWAWQPPPASPVVEATAFDVYRRSRAEAPSELDPEAAQLHEGGEFNPVYLRGEHPSTAAFFSAEGRVRRAGSAADPDLRRQWRATPVVAADDGLGVYWLSRLESRP
ncbi:MAG: M56 family metallopeptidase [Nitriliruptorales bacterium]